MNESLSPVLRPNRRHTGETFRIGVIGYGYWGPNLVRVFQGIDDCSVVCVADLDPRRLGAVRKVYPRIETTPDALKLIDRDDLDAVVVATPASSHYALASSALLAGKHVLVSKPMTRTVQEAEQLISIAERQNKVLFVDHTFIYSGPVRKIRELIEASELGDLYYYDSVRVNLGLFQTDVNVLWDLAAHDFSMITYLIPKLPIQILAIGAQPIDYPTGRVESVAYVTLKYGDGAIAHLHLSWLSPVKIRRTLIAGSKKMVVYDHLDPDNQVKVYDKGIEVRSVEEQYRAMVQYRLGDMHAPKVDQIEALEVECRHFLNCCIKGDRPASGGSEGLKVVSLLEAAQASMDRGGEVIKLELPWAEAYRA